MTTPIQQYHQLLLDAHQASDAADRYDLNSDDPASQKKFDELLLISDVAQRQLISFIYRNASYILDNFDAIKRSLT